MLNKDEYNQEAYNDFYAKATESAEIKHFQKKGGGSKLLLIFLLLALIGTLGYFVWENITSKKDVNSNATIAKEDSSAKVIKNKDEKSKTSDNIEKTTKKTEEELLAEELQKTLEPTEETSENKQLSADSSTTPDEKKQDSSNTADIVANIASQTTNSKMSPADIARIVQLVTQQMQVEKQTEEKKVLNRVKKKDSLEASLENVETDTLLSEEPIVAPKDGSQKKEATLSNKTNTYNKIVIKNSDKNENITDELSQLSMEISNVINSDTDSSTKDTTKYTSSLSKEANTRSKEMRYHIVKKGDTLAAIAYKIYGKSSDYIKLYEANPDILRRADKIYIGQRLRVPE